MIARSEPNNETADGLAETVEANAVDQHRKYLTELNAIVIAAKMALNEVRQGRETALSPVRLLQLGLRMHLDGSNTFVASAEQALDLGQVTVCAQQAIGELTEFYDTYRKYAIATDKGFVFRRSVPGLNAAPPTLKEYRYGAELWSGAVVSQVW